MVDIPVTVAVEGLSDEPVARRLLRAVKLELATHYIAGGKAHLDKKLRGYNNAAQFAPWFVMRDMDHDADCAPDLVAQLLPDSSEKMAFRIAVRETEAWLLADRDSLSKFLGVGKNRVPLRPDDLDDPKATLVGLARVGTNRAVREDIVPSPDTTASVGPGYVGRLTEFATLHWSPVRASRVSPSLKKCIAALRRLKKAART